MNELEKIPLDSAKKKVTQAFLNNTGLFMGVFLIFAVIVIMTTDVHIVSLADISSLGLDFFLLIFCSYSMYVCCADSGTRAGLASSSYKETVEKFDALKKQIDESPHQAMMVEFCKHYVEDELRNTRMMILSVVGIPYEAYQAKYMMLSETEVDAITELTEAQRKAVKNANKIKPIKLTTEMVLSRSMGGHKRGALDANPKTKKKVKFLTKFFQIGLVSVLMSMIAFDIIVEPSWVIFASVCLKLLAVVVNGFGGHKMGLENICVDTVDYMQGQIDLMQQGIHYIAQHTKDTPTNE